MKNIEISAGSVCGRDHLWTGRNNQDAFCWASTPNATLLIVCDGCGGCRFSETGAQLGARLAVATLLKHVNQWLEKTTTGFATEDTENTEKEKGKREGGPEARTTNGEFPYWEGARQEMLRAFEPLLPLLGTRPAAVVSDFFLFTIVGALLTERSVSVFSIGDGLIVLNGKVLRVGPFAGNEPPYLAYALVESALNRKADPLCISPLARGREQQDPLCISPLARGREPGDELRFRVHATIPAAEFQSLLIATDGAADWDKIAARRIPGRTDPVGPLAQFWQNDCYFRNPDMLRRRLALISRDVVKPDWERRQTCKEVGLLADDTTMIVCRRKAEGEKGRTGEGERTEQGEKGGAR